VIIKFHDSTILCIVEKACRNISFKMPYEQALVFIMNFKFIVLIMLLIDSFP